MMAIKVNDFIIQAKVKEDAPIQRVEGKSDAPVASGSAVPDSVKQEIIDECLEKLSELIDEKLKT
jgi:hypothetical protein